MPRHDAEGEGDQHDGDTDDGGQEPRAAGASGLGNGGWAAGE